MLILDLEPHLSKFIQRLFFLLINSNLVTNVNLWLKSPKNKEFGDSSVYFWDSPFFSDITMAVSDKGPENDLYFMTMLFQTPWSGSHPHYPVNLVCEEHHLYSPLRLSQDKQTLPPFMYSSLLTRFSLYMDSMSLAFKPFIGASWFCPQIEQSCQPKVPIYQQLHQLNNLVSGFSRFLVRSFINLLQKF